MDWTTRQGRVLADRLESEMLIWLTTVGSKGTPFPSLVWFWWDGEEVLLYSRPERLKLRNIDERPRVALGFNSNPSGGAVGVMAGKARHDPGLSPAHLHPGYLGKYEEWIRDHLGADPEDFAADYSEPIVVRIESGRTG